MWLRIQKGKKFQKLDRELRNFSSIKLKFKDFKFISKNAKLQTIISLGNQQISDLLLNYYTNGATPASLEKAERALNFSIDNYLLKIRDCYTPWII